MGTNIFLGLFTQNHYVMHNKCTNGERDENYVKNCGMCSICCKINANCGNK